MPKSDKAKNSQGPIQNQILVHHPEVVELLRVDTPICDFQTCALDLVRHGLHIHPLKPGDKAPMLKGWQRQASTDPNLIEQWSQDYPRANVGIVTGEPSGVIIIDCDLRHGAHASLNWLKRQYGDLPLTWSMLTPNGWHFYFKHPGGQVRSYNSLAAGIEIKGEGSNVVGVGSIHPNGLCYRWQPGCSPSDIELAEVPEWLLEILKRKGKWRGPGEIRSTQCQVNILGLGVFLGRGFGEVASLSGRDVLSYFGDESVVKKLLPLLGLGEVEIGEKFDCVLHLERRASASILRPEKVGDPFMYMDFHGREEGRQAFPLPLVYYVLKQGKGEDRIKELPKPTFLVWALRLLRDAGVIAGVKVEGPRLPDGVKPVVRRVYDGFLDLLSLKFLVEKEASPYTWRFVETWVGVSRKAASSAMRWLISAGFIRFVNYFGSEEAGNRVQLFLMGTRRLVRRLSGRVMLSRGGQTEIINDVQVAVEALEQECEQEEEGKRALKLCKGCGEVTEWVQFDDLVICLNCWQTIDTC